MRDWAVFSMVLEVCMKYHSLDKGTREVFVEVVCVSRLEYLTREELIELVGEHFIRVLLVSVIVL